MPRITKEERFRFHEILDNSIDKTNSPKNSDKIHWSKVYIRDLQKMINLNMMMVDNLRGNQ